MPIAEIIGAIGGLAGGAGGLLGGLLGDKGGNPLADILDDPAIIQMLQQALNLQVHDRDMARRGILQGPLAAAVDKIKQMTDVELGGQLDDITDMGWDLEQRIDEQMAERGITGGQTSMRKQQLMDSLRKSVLQSRRAAQAKALGAESQAFMMKYGDEKDLMNTLMGAYKGLPSEPSGYTAAQGWADFARGITGDLGDSIEGIRAAFGSGKVPDSGGSVTGLSEISKIMPFIPNIP